jgi:hypothetical protein
VAAIAVIAGMVGTLMQTRAARRQRDFAYRQLARAERVNNLNDFLLSDTAPGGNPLTINELLDRAVRIVEREDYSGDAGTHVELLIAIGIQYSARGTSTRRSIRWRRHTHSRRPFANRRYELAPRVPWQRP